MSTAQAPELTEVFSSNQGKYSITYTGPDSELVNAGQRLTTDVDDFIARSKTYLYCYNDLGDTIIVPVDSLNSEQLADIIWQEHLASEEHTPTV